MPGVTSPARLGTITMGCNTMGIDRSLLCVAELQHRISNEYAKTISFVSRLAALSSTPEVKAPLFKVIDYLHAGAKMHNTLRPPLPGEAIDFAAHITELCRVFASAGLEQRGVGLHLTTSGSAVLDATRSWYASLIIEELVTNSVRHASPAEGARICVAVGTDGENIICQITDHGTSSASTVRPGVGSHLVDALTDELQGRISRSYTAMGAVVALCFPIKPKQH